MREGGGGVRLYFLSFPGGIGHCIYILLGWGGGGGIQNLDDGSKSQPAPSDT